MDAVHLHLGVFQDDQFVRRGVVTAPALGSFPKVARVPCGHW